MVKYYREILIFIRGMVKDTELAKDLTQETYIKVLEKENYQNLENKKAYLYKIAKNLVIDGVRKKKNFVEVTYEEGNYSIPKEDEVEEILTKKDEHTQLMSCIKSLPKRNKEAFILNIIQGYSRQEVAIKMNISVNAVEKNIARAAIKIQEELKSKGNGYE